MEHGPILDDLMEVVVARLALVSRTPRKASTDQVAAGLRAFFQMQELWKLKNEQAIVLLGQPSKSTFHNWKKGQSVSASVDLATRLGYLLGIFRALEILYQKPELADRWVTQPNLVFGGSSALDRMMGGQITDLAKVRDYLDSVRGGW